MVSKKVTYTILSISLLTVMAGAAMAPALGEIQQHFIDCSHLTVQFIVSLPALFIIVTNLCFSRLCRYFGTKTIAIAGLLLYVLSGAGAFFVGNIAMILVLRALLGISVGMVMPLSTGLLAFYFPPEAQAGLMGLSAAMNQLGGVVATLLAGLLASVGWNYAFLVYLLGLVALAMVVAFLPNEHLRNEGSAHISLKTLLRFHPSVVGMLLLMCVFFVFPTNFAVVTSQTTALSGTYITIIMVGLDVVAFGIGLVFGLLMEKMRKAVKYMAPLCFAGGYACYAFGIYVPWLVVGSVLIGVANGVGVPYLNTIASVKGGRDSATTVMPLLSAALYLGQFVSPLLVSLIARCFPSDDVLVPYKVAVLLSALFLVQVFATRKHQSQPPTKD